MKDIINNRLKTLGIRVYEVSRRVAKARNEEGKIVTAQQVNSAVTNTFENPDDRKFSLVVEVLEALGGEIVVRFPSVEEFKLK